VATIESLLSGNGRCSFNATSAGAVIHCSISSGAVRITGIALTDAAAQGVSLQRIAIRLNRSKGSIRTRARELGLEIKVVKRLLVEQRFSFRPKSNCYPACGDDS
jgi:hypothetical protein